MGKVLDLEAKRPTAAAQYTRLQSRRGQAREGSPLTPELKEFIDAAIVPILVKEYLALENELAVKPPRAAHSLNRTAAPRPRNVKP